jgi:uncharacterized protein
LGFKEFRLRIHNDLARIEVARSELNSVFDGDRFQRITEKIKSLGFRYVTLDMEGFRSGALNESSDNK